MWCSQVNMLQFAAVNLKHWFHCMPSQVGINESADVLVQVCLGAAIGISNPQSVAWCSSGLFTSLLGFLMLSMGLTLTFEDFRKVRQIA